MADEAIPEALEDMVSRSRVAIFIGRNDTGKSTLIRDIADKLDVSIIDADIGQSDIGPPSVVSLGEKRNGRYRMVDGYFCGSTSPAKHLLQLLAGTSRMAARVKKFPALVNTTGLATGEVGRILKTEKINALSPDLIVGIGGKELYYLDAFGRGAARVIRLPVSPFARIKTRAERTRLRQQAFAGHFAGGRLATFPFQSFSTERSLLFNGISPGSRDDVLRIDVSGAEAMAVVSDRFQGARELMNDLGVRLLHLYHPEDFKGALVGLVDDKGIFAGLGIIEAMDFDSEEISLFTPARYFSILQFGSIRLDPRDFSYRGTFTGLVLRA